MEPISSTGAAWSAVLGLRSHLRADSSLPQIASSDRYRRTKSRASSHSLARAGEST